MQRALRRVALVACFALALGAVLEAGLSWLRDARLGRPTIVFDYARMIEKRLPALADAGRGGRRTVAFLGDSGIVSYPEGRTVPERLQETLDAASAGVHVTSLGMSGSGPFEYYCLADRIAGARPDAVVISLNLDHFSDAWRGAYSRPQLAGWIAPARLGEALGMSFHWIGLTADRLLFYVALVQAGAYEPWYWLSVRQAQVGRARDRFEQWLQGGGDSPEQRFRKAADARTIARVFTGPDLRHYREAGLLEHYRSTLAGVAPDHPVLEAVGGTVRRLRDAGVRVLVYAAPIEVSWLESQGLLAAGDFRTTLERTREVVTSNGGDFADLHDRLPAEAFRDAPGHLRHSLDGLDGLDGPGGLDGPAQLAALLEPHVIRLLRGAPPDGA